MQAFEFHATAQNGFIKIPDEYVLRIGREIRVILLPADMAQSPQAKPRRSLGDLIGVLKDCGDVDLEQVRTERLNKYENLD